MNVLMLLALPSMVVGYIWGYVKRGFEVGIEIAEEHIDKDCTMNTAATLLHDMRSQQLRALADNFKHLSCPAQHRVTLWARLCGAQYDTRNLSDKALEEIDTLAGKYLERVK